MAAMVLLAMVVVAMGVAAAVLLQRAPATGSTIAENWTDPGVENRQVMPAGENVQPGSWQQAVVLHGDANLVQSGAQPGSPLTESDRRQPGFEAPASTDDTVSPVALVASGTHPATQPAGPSATEKPRVAVERPYLEETEDNELTISGRVISDAGTPVAGIEVYSRSVRDEPGPDSEQGVYLASRQTATSDELGRFRFDFAAPGRFKLSTSAGDDHSAGSLVVKTGSHYVDLVVDEYHELTISGSVVDEVWMPIAGVEISTVPGGAVATTDEEGNYRLSLGVRQEKTYHLTYEAEGYRTRHRALAGAELVDAEDGFEVNETLEFVETTTMLSGTVLNEHGNPVEGQRVQLVFPGQADRRLARTDEYGEFEFAEVAVGNGYRLGVSPEWGYKPLTVPVLNLEPGPTRLELTLESTTEYAAIAGRVTDPDGMPIPGFSLLIDAEAAGRNTISARTNTNGEFLVHGVPAGPVVLRSGGQPNLLVVNANLRPGETRPMEIPVDWGGRTLMGTVVDQSGKPVPGARVGLHWARRDGPLLIQTTRSARSDLNGQFGFSNLGGGTRSLMVSSNEFDPLKRTVNVDGGAQFLRLVVNRTL